MATQVLPTARHAPIDLRREQPSVAHRAARIANLIMATDISLAPYNRPRLQTSSAMPRRLRVLRGLPTARYSASRGIVELNADHYGEIDPELASEDGAEIIEIDETALWENWDASREAWGGEGQAPPTVTLPWDVLHEISHAKLRELQATDVGQVHLIRAEAAAANAVGGLNRRTIKAQLTSHAAERGEFFPELMSVYVLTGKLPRFRRSPLVAEAGKVLENVMLPGRQGTLEVHRQFEALQLRQPQPAQKPGPQQIL